METTLKIEGMTCVHCVRAVREVLASVPGITIADVQVGEARVHLADEAGREAAVQAIEAEGYRVAEAA